MPRTEKIWARAKPCFLLLTSDTFARNPGLELIGGRLRLLLAGAISYCLVVQGLQFTKKLAKAVPRFERLQRALALALAVRDTLLSAAFNSSVGRFITCQLPASDDSHSSAAASRHSCGEGEACMGRSGRQASPVHLFYHPRPTRTRNRRSSFGPGNGEAFIKS